MYRFVSSFTFYVLFSFSSSPVLCLTWQFSAPNSQFASEHFTKECLNKNSKILNVGVVLIERDAH